jgi:D-alanyl-D-alanine carboxypeptidase (penicillin-binding protein 5/6)
VESASDCTALIVFELCSSEAEFVALMNQKVTELGLTQTHFDNAIGYNSDDNYTTASEMGMILSYALQCDRIKDILSVTSYRFEAYYYNNEGEYAPFGFTYYSTLFRSRMETYEKHSGKKFSLSTATLEAGKTGYLDSSFLACQAKGKNNSRYILILGDATGSSAGLACYYTMRDVKYVLDTYVP